jgi:purine-binding chemotaxis protein CheW
MEAKVLEEKPGDSIGDLLQLVSFNLENEEYGINILDVQEIIRPSEITTVPNSPSWIEGVINLRGRVIPVINLRKKFGITAGRAGLERKIIVVDVDGRVVGLLVDGVNEVLRVDSGIIDPPPALTPANHSEYISGVCKMEGRLIILLDLRRLIDDSTEG